MSRDIMPRVVGHSALRVLSRKLCERFGPDLCPFDGTPEKLCVAGDDLCVKCDRAAVEAKGWTRDGAIAEREDRYDDQPRELTPDGKELAAKLEAAAPESSSEPGKEPGDTTDETA